MCGVCECAEQRSGGKIGSRKYTTSDTPWGSCRTVLAMAGEQICCCARRSQCGPRAVLCRAERGVVAAALDWAVGEVVDGLKDAGKTVPLLCVSTAFVAEALPLPCVFTALRALRHCICLVCYTASLAKTLHLPCILRCLSG